MHDANRTANLLGAAVLAIGDLVRTETASAAGTSASGAAALVVPSLAGPRPIAPSPRGTTRWPAASPGSTRRAGSSAVAVVGQVGEAVLALVVALLVTAPHVTLGALGWDALSGLGSGIGVSYLYRGMSRGNARAG